MRRDKKASRENKGRTASEKMRPPPLSAKEEFKEELGLITLANNTVDLLFQ